MSISAEFAELYAVALAPLASDTLLEDLPDMSADDFTLDALLGEVSYMRKLLHAGLWRFESGLKTKSDETAAALVCLAGFARRIQTLAGYLSFMATSTYSAHVGEDVDDAEKKAELEALLEKTSSSARDASLPIDTAGELSNLLNLTPNMRWASLDTTMEKIFASRTATTGGAPKAVVKSTKVVTLSGVDEETEKAKSDKSAASSRRGSRRKPTAFAKFTFKDTDLEQLVMSGEEEHKDTDKDSDREDAKTTATAATTGDAASSARRSRMADTTMSDEETMGGETTATADASQLDTDRDSAKRSQRASLQSDDFPPAGMSLERRTSSVNFDSFNTIEIHDKDSDPKWGEKQRKEKRFSRIRKRVPTGHPSLMKLASDEMKQIMAAVDPDDHELIANTDKNKNVSQAEEGGRGLPEDDGGGGVLLDGAEEEATKLRFRSRDF